MKIIGIFSLLITIFLISCNSFDNDSSAFILSSIKNDGVNKKVYKSLSFYSYCNEISYDSRSIMANGFTNSDLDFYLYGYNSETKSKVQFLDGSNCLKVYVQSDKDDEHNDCGKFTIEIEPGPYLFTLDAVLKGDDYDNSNPNLTTVLRGSTTVDLRNNNVFKVYLTSRCFDNDYNLNVKGSCNIALYTEGWSISSYEDFSANVGLYKKGVSGESTPVKIKLNYDLESYDYGVKPDFSDFLNIFECETISGSYNLVICFTDGKKKYYYSDSLIISPNRNFNIVLAIPNVINESLKAPENFFVGYCDSSDYGLDRYYIDAEWIDNSNNEEYFQLELLDITEPENLLNYTAYVNSILGVSVDLPGLKQDDSWILLQNDCGCPKPIIISNQYFIDNGYSIEGDLSRNSNYVIFSLPMSKKYLLRLCAVNSEGFSEYVYPNIYDGNFISGNSNVCSWKTDARSINRYAIYYDTSNGYYYDDVDFESGILTNVTSEVKKSYQYKSIVYSYDSVNGTKIFVPENFNYNTGKTASLGQYFDGVYYTWLGWKKDYLEGDFIYRKGGGDVYYNDFKSIKLYSFFREDEEVGTDENRIKPFTSENDSIDNSTLLLYGGEYENSGTSGTIKAMDDDQISIFKHSPDGKYLYIMCRTSVENFSKAKLWFGKQGFGFSDKGVGNKITARWSWGPIYSYSYWTLETSELTNGLYFIKLEAYEDEKDEPYTYILKVYVND